MNTKLHVLYLPLVLLCAMLSLPEQFAGAQEQKEGDLPVIEVGLPKGGMFGLGGAYIIDKKLDRKYGFIYKPRWTSVSAAERLMAIGAIPSGLATSESAVRANIKGNKLRLIQPYMMPHQHVLVRKDSPYKTLADLKGKPVAITPEVTSSYNMFDMIMRDKGIMIESDLQLKKFSAPAGIIAVLEKGDVEAAVLWEAHVSKMLATGRYRVLAAIKDEMARRLDADVKMMGWIGATEAWVQENPELVKKVRLAWQEMTNELPTDEAHFRKYAKPMFGLETPEAVELGWQRARTFLLPRNFNWPDQKNLDAEKKYLYEGIKVGMFPEEGSREAIEMMFVK